MLSILDWPARQHTRYGFKGRRIQLLVHRAHLECKCPEKRIWIHYWIMNNWLQATAVTVWVEKLRGKLSMSVTQSTIKISGAIFSGLWSALNAGEGSSVRLRLKCYRQGRTAFWPKSSGERNYGHGSQRGAAINKGNNRYSSLVSNCWSNSDVSPNASVGILQQPRRNKQA